MVQWFFRVKAQRFSASGSDACGCHDPPGGVSLLPPHTRAPGENP
jgi:hypothetical protein